MNKKKEIKQLKPPVEVRYKEELDILKATDTGKKPENWVLSPKAVRTFILGSEKPIEYEGNKYSISKKYYGNDQPCTSHRHYFTTTLLWWHQHDLYCFCYW